MLEQESSLDPIQEDSDENFGDQVPQDFIEKQEHEEEILEGSYQNFEEEQ
jgi:hypothetical protein